MSNKIKQIIFIFIVFLLLFSCKEKNKIPPSTKKVKTVKNDIKNKLIEQNKKIQFSSLFDENLKNFLVSKKAIIRIIIILIGVSFFITVVVLLLRYFIVQKNSKFKDKSHNHITSNQTFFQDNDIKELIKKRQYSRAILLMHYHSIYFLLQNHIAYTKNMTNFDFYRRIQDKKELAEAFKTIYKISEKIIFDNYEATFNEYNLCEKQYKAHFIKKDIRGS